MNTATVYGSVSDPAGAVVPNAQAELDNAATGAKLAANTNSSGDFSFPFVPVGTYRLSVSAPGFQSEVRTGLQFSAGQNVRLNFTLHLGTVQQSVTVTGEAPLVNAVNAEQQTTMSTRQVTQLPESRMDWTSLLSLNTGAAPNGSGEVTMNGLAPSAFSITVDGTNASQDPEYSTLSMPSNFNTIKVISPDAIQEVSVTKGIAPAEVAGTMSGNVNVITRGGTNNFRGDLFENNQVAAYNARNGLLPRKTGDTFNQFGGSLGGPIIKDKLFFFATYEGLRESAYDVVSGSVPTPLFLSEASAANPGYGKDLGVYPLPNQPYSAKALTATYLGPGSTTSSDNHGVLRNDYQLTDRDLITLRYTHSEPGETIPRIISIDSRQFTTSSNAGTASYTHTFGGAVAVTRFGYNRLSLLRLDGLHNVPDYNILAVPGLTTGAGESFGLGGSSLSVEQTLAFNKGRNSIKFGGIFERSVDGRNDHDIPNIKYASTSSFLAQIPSQVTINFGVNPFNLYQYQSGGFIQDDFKYNQRLTLNLGVRYDYYSVVKESQGKLFNRTDYGFGPLLPPGAVYNPDLHNIAPRVGFAYALDHSGTTVLRGGFGIFDSPHSLFAGGINIQQDSALIPARAILNGTQASALGLNFPVSTSSVENLILDGALLLPWTANAINPNFPNPFSMQYTMEVQRQLSSNVVLSAAYVGNRGIDLDMVRMENLANPVTNQVPVPGFGQFRYIDSSNTSNYNSLQLSLKKRYSSGLSFDLNYTWGRSMGYGTSDVGLETPPQDQNNIRQDYGPTPFDVQQVFVVGVIYELPFARWVKPAIWRAIAGGWQISGILTASTGSPVNVVESTNYPAQRPNATGVSPYANAGLQYLNPAAFVLVPDPSGNPLYDGSLGRDALFGPGFWTQDLALARTFAFGERAHLQLRLNAFNAFNHANPSGIQASLPSSNFGQVTALGNRTVQLSGRLTF